MPIFVYRNQNVSGVLAGDFVFKVHLALVFVKRISNWDCALFLNKKPASNLPAGIHF